MSKHKDKLTKNCRGTLYDLDVSDSDSLAGKIETLQMTNFMCHSNLELKFNQMINFITGRNGSGKSAIMAALVVVLGGTATLTGRGSGLSDFIKKGENWAKVSITLINDGINSFKREFYGSRITISRNISKTGANSYACKSETGCIVSKKKEEIDSIILSFNWQIKNPICVLNQDVARSFLCATDNEMRFSMFARATQLEHLKNIYTKTMELLTLTKKQLQMKEKGIEEANEEILRLKEKLILFVSLEKYVHQKRSLENEYVWSLVIEEEKKLENLNEKKKCLKEKENEVLESGNNFEELMSKLKSEIEECQKAMEKAKASENLKKAEKFNLERKIQELEKQIEKSEMHVRQAESKVERNQADINGVKEHIERYDINSNKNEEEKKKTNQKMISLREDLAEVREKIAIAQRDYDEAQETKMHHSRTVESLKLDLGELEQNQKRLEILLNNGKSKGHNNLMKYGYFTQELLRAIEEASKRNLFYKKPVGPCGLYVNLSGDPKWARAVESVVGGLLATYCCDNQKDFQVLNRIMDRICGDKQPTVIISKFLSKRYNVESRKASVRDHPSILDVLSFEHDVVFNTFIDQARIETIVLFDTDKQAACLMTRIQNVPKNLKMGLTAASDQYFPAPNYRTYYGNSTKPIVYFDSVTKSADALKKIEAEMKAVGNSIEKKNVELVKAKREYGEVCEGLIQFQNSIKHLRQSERKIQVELNHMKDIEDSTPVAITKVALEEELLSLQESYTEFSKKVEQCKEVLGTLNNKKNELIATLNALTMEENIGENNFENMADNLEVKKCEHSRLMRQKADADSYIANIKAKIKEVNEEISKRMTVVEKKLREAEEICPERVNSDKSPVEVQKLLEKCERYLKTAEKITGSKENTIKEYKTKMDSFKSMSKMAEILKRTMETLVKATSNKLERLKILQTHTANLVSFHFQATLQTRGYDGQLKVDFDSKLLDLEVAPKDGTDPRKDSKTLSGGERSYSTVSFILAIWKVVNMPVYFLDEFDVFMDKVNRKVIMDLLLEHATAHNNKQFVFITPQDISSVQASNLISVYRLPDPKRKASDCQ